MRFWDLRHQSIWRLGAAFGALAIAACIAVPGRALANDSVEGKRLWAEKAQCLQCHGWAGDGVGSFHSEGKAPSLRQTSLTRDEIRMTIQCGRPGTPMPFFDRFAYTDKRCYDMTAADLGENAPNRGTTTLQSYEIDAVADYVVTSLKGSGPPTKAECQAFFKDQAGSRCDPYPN